MLVLSWVGAERVVYIVQSDGVQRSRVAAEREPVKTYRVARSLEVSNVDIGGARVWIGGGSFASHG